MLEASVLLLVICLLIWAFYLFSNPPPLESIMSSSSTISKYDPRIGDYKKAIQLWIDHYRHLQASGSVENDDVGINDYIFDTLGWVKFGNPIPSIIGIRNAQALKKLFMWADDSSIMTDTYTLKRYKLSPKKLFKLFKESEKKMSETIETTRYLYKYPASCHVALSRPIKEESSSDDSDLSPDNDSSSSDEDDDIPTIVKEAKSKEREEKIRKRFEQKEEDVKEKQPQPPNKKQKTKDEEAQDLLVIVCKARAKVEEISGRVVNLQDELTHTKVELDEARDKLYHSLAQLNAHFGN